VLKPWKLLGIGACVALAACSEAATGSHLNPSQPSTSAYQAHPADRAVSQVDTSGPFTPSTDPWGRRGASRYRYCLRLYVGCLSVAQQENPVLPGPDDDPYARRRRGCSSLYVACRQRYGL